MPGKLITVFIARARSFFSFIITAAVVFVIGLSSKATAQSQPTPADLQLMILAQSYRLNEVALAKVVENRVLSQTKVSRTRLVVLEHGPIGKIRMKIREPLKAGRYPVLFMSTGLHAGMEALDLVKFEAPAIVVAYDYPVDKNAHGADFVVSVLSGLLPMQGQLVVALNWVKSQDNVRADRINIMNVSFGTFATPMAQRLARLLGVEIYSTIYAFGGADPLQLILPELNKAVSAINVSRSDYENFVSTLTRITDILDSRHHLPYLSGRFLVIQGLRDTVIPAASTKALFDALAGPKDLIQLDLPHISSDRIDVIEATSRTAIKWMIEQGALN